MPLPNKVSSRVPPVIPRQSRSQPVRPAALTRMPALPSLLTPEELDRYKNLLVFAKSTVEGYFSGKHKSQRIGSSAEFADYKEYVAGDDLKRVDWRVYGRARRLFVRRYVEETDMVAYLLVDTSASMRYAGEKRLPKFYVAAKIAAALSYLMLQQGDKTALALFDEHVTYFLPPGGTRRHLHQLVTDLEHVKPSATTSLVSALLECGELFNKRGHLVILSDFLVDTSRLFETLSLFLHRKFSILLLHVLDPDELQLPNLALARLVDLETGEQVQVELDEIRRSYSDQIQQLISTLAREADTRQIRYCLVDARQPYWHALETYLGFREARS